jgi:hypothetical protein
VHLTNPIPFGLAGLDPFKHMADGREGGDHDGKRQTDKAFVEAFVQERA